MHCTCDFLGNFRALINESTSTQNWLARKNVDEFVYVTFMLVLHSLIARHVYEAEVMCCKANSPSKKNWDPENLSMIVHHG